MKSRTFGWVQDASTIEKLRATVEVFDCESPTYRLLIEDRIPRLVKEQDRRDRFLTELSSTPLELKYKDLVGTDRKDMCTGILQAALKGQKREFMRNWPADNFLRWAHALGFIQYDSDASSFSITKFGLKYTRSRPKVVDGSQQLLPNFDGQRTDNDEKEILTQAFLSNPPVMRVLTLLANASDSHLTKFEIGSQLGFVGEDGFTSFPQNILVIKLAETEDSTERNKILSDLEGTSDKYARMIANWLKYMGWVRQEKKLIVTTLGNKEYEYVIPQAYRVTTEGLKAIRRGLGTSTHSRIPKNVFWQMLATKGRSRDYARTRRALILQKIVKKSTSVQELQQMLTNKGFNESETTIVNDLEGLKQIGLNVQHEQKGYFLQDTIENLVVPGSSTDETVEDAVQGLVDQCRERLNHVSHDYLILIPLSFDKKRSQLFEMKTVELLVEQCKFNGFHLGGASQPDGLIFTQELTEDYGVIIDTKAYKDGFSFPIAERDKMTRYVNQNIQRDKRVSLKWWENFPADVNLFKFLFVSSKFIGEYENGLRQISISTQDTTGAAITSYNLLLLAEEIAKGKMDLQNVREKFSCLSSVEIES